MSKAASTVRTPRAAFGKLLLNETRLTWRTPLGLVLGLGMPIVLLIIFGSIPALNKPTHSLGGLSYFDVSLPILIGVSVLSVSFLALPTRLASYREQGILRRLSTTPVPPAWLLAAQVMINLCIGVVGLLILIVVGMVAFHLNAPKAFGDFVLAAVLTTTSLFAVGLWITAIARTSGSAGVIGALLYYPMLFFSGIWVPREVMPRILRDVSDWTPIGASVGSIQNAMQGTPISWHLMVAMLLYTVVFGYLAVRYFKWE